MPWLRVVAEGVGSPKRRRPIRLLPLHPGSKKRTVLHATPGDALSAKAIESHHSNRYARGTSSSDDW